MDELRIVLKREEDIQSFLKAKKNLCAEGNVEALRGLLTAFCKKPEKQRRPSRSNEELAEKLEIAEDHVKELKEKLDLKERYIRLADERLMFYMLRRRPLRIQRLVNLLEYACDAGRPISAKGMRLEFDTGMPVIRRDLKELLDLGLLFKPHWGRYLPTPEADVENKAGVIARRMAQRDGEIRIRREGGEERPS